MDDTKYPAIRAIRPRELECAKLKATGLANKEVAHLLGVSEQTVKNHLSNLYAVLGVSSLEGAMFEMGWVFPGGLTPEAIADALARKAHVDSIRARETLDAVIATGAELIREAEAVKAMLAASSARAVPKHG